MNFYLVIEFRFSDTALKKKIYKDIIRKIEFRKSTKVEIEKLKVFVVDFKNTLIKTADKSKRWFIMERLGKMDDAILTKNLDNVDGFIKSFQDGSYPVLMSADEYWERLVLKNVWWKIVDWYWNIISDRTKVDFIVTKWAEWKDWIVFWTNHSFLSDWKNVNYAWEIYFDSNWNITWWGNRSWHYVPDKDDLYWIQNMKNAFYNRMNWLEFNFPMVNVY